MMPEVITLANSYIQNNMDAEQTSLALGIPEEQVREMVKKQRDYINSVMMTVGYNNSFRLNALMDRVIEKKLEEAEETDIFSNKDLADLIKLRAQMNKDAGFSGPSTQTNIQINKTQNNYSELLSELMTD